MTGKDLQISYEEINTIFLPYIYRDSDKAKNHPEIIEPFLKHIPVVKNEISYREGKDDVEELKMELSAVQFSVKRDNGAVLCITPYGKFPKQYTDYRVAILIPCANNTLSGHEVLFEGYINKHNAILELPSWAKLFIKPVLDMYSISDSLCEAIRTEYMRSDREIIKNYFKD